jgi:hypothetical protein
MKTTMTTDLAMSAVREICARPRRSANTAHAGTFGSDQGRTVPFAGRTDRDESFVVGLRAVVGTGPVTGFGYPRLEAPPV